MSYLQVIECEDTKNHFIYQIMNLLWLLNGKGTHVSFCWIPSYCCNEDNEIVDQIAKETRNVHYADMKPLVKSYIQELISNQVGCGCTW